MEETINTIKDNIKDRLTNPFLGKLLSAWLIWNWKIPYITFFVDEDNLIPKTDKSRTNRLEEVSDYLTPDSFLDFGNVYLVPIIITAILIWVIPSLSNIVSSVSENRRRDREIKKKKIDNEISGYTDEQISRLQSEISSLKRQSKKNLEQFKELSLVAEYLSQEPELVINANNEEFNTEYLEKLRKEIYEANKKGKVLTLLEEFHIKNSDNHFEKIEKKDLIFLIRNDILKKENNTYYLTKYGEFISKNILYEKYSHIIPDFHHRTLIDD